MINGNSVFVGDNNSGKSTIFEAIDLVMGPDRLARHPVIDEHDFYGGEYLKGDEKVQIYIEVIVIDHHEPGIIFENNIKKEILPPAYTIVDPKQEDCGYKFKFLCAGGLAYKFSKLLTESFGLDYDKDRELLSFAAIATICDSVDLIGENRIIAYEGLKSI